MSFQIQEPISRPVNQPSFSNRVLPVLLGISAGYLVAAEASADPFTWYGRAHATA